jgi:hypothetical protein
MQPAITVYKDPFKEKHQSRSFFSDSIAASCRPGVFNFITAEIP